MIKVYVREFEQETSDARFLGEFLPDDLSSLVEQFKRFPTFFQPALELAESGIVEAQFIVSNDMGIFFEIAIDLSPDD